ncbi:M23 family metallopeptidase [Sporohalobacter salinus]|uniref:M23 family metallopeptidase n=1 Tax=Sporohalobacter salinus TaxID=1494606 RepID=UPI00196000F2|nr:M23 family metallopeptidase [Sporohalobacter salinus]MBM7622905.1 murein DD-endopeptidase MepM/ murein hydrolase activator NlpD [Sporohalobacter salinus]
MSDRDDKKNERNKEQNGSKEKKKFPFSIKKDRDNIKLKLKKNIEELANKFSWKRFVTRFVTNKKFLVGLAVIILAGIIFIPQLSDSTSQSNPSNSESSRAQDKVITYEHIPSQQEKVKQNNQQQQTATKKKEKVTSKEEVKTDVGDDKESSVDENKSKPVIQQANIQPKFNLPVKGSEISRPYGWSKHPMLEDWRYHQGIDLQVAKGTSIKAAASGKITKIKEDDYLGLILIIKHNSDYQTIYGHAQEFYLKEGQQVKAGQAIGKVGSSGLVIEPTFHFGVLKGNETVDPTEYINL